MQLNRVFIRIFTVIALLGLAAWAIEANAQVTPPTRGGTGTSIVPSYGQVLVGLGNGMYIPMATSSLGIVGGGGGGSSFATSSADYWITTKTTSALSEGSNLYYTLARVQTALLGGYNAVFGNATATNATTTNLAVSGSFNFLGTVITNVSTWFNGLFDARLAAKTTDNLTEGSTNLYFTNGRARSAISETVTGLDYASATGILSLTSGYSIPLSASTTDWNTAYLGRITSASAPLSIASNVLSLSTAGDWNGTFDGQEGVYYLGRANQTGTQLASTISNFATTVAGIIAGTTTDALPEGVTNQYFTSARARSAVSLTTTGSSGAATYNSSTGVFNVPQYAGTSYTASYPVTLAGSVFGLAFGTTTTNTWSALNTFSGGVTITGNTVLANATSSNEYSGRQTANTAAFGQSGSTTVSSAGALVTPSATVGSLAGIIKGSAGLLSTASNGTDYTLISALTCSAGQFVSAVTAAGVFSCTSPSGGGSGLGTTTPWTVGQLAQVASNGAVNSIATSSLGLLTTNVAEGSNLYYTDTRARAALSASWPISYNNSTGAFSWSGLATTTQPANSNILVSNGSNGIYGVATSTLTAGTGLSGSFTQLGTGGTVSCATASGSVFGCLTSADWTTFNGKVAASRAINTTYPLQGGGDLSADRTLSLAFGTTTSNTWAGTQTFTNSPVLSSLSAGTVNTNGGALYSTATSSFAVSSSFSYSGTLGGLVGGTGGTLSIVSAGVSNAMLANSTISGISLGSFLANLTATDTTLTFSGTYNGGNARTVGLNLANANVWTALQRFSTASSTLSSVTGTLYVGGTATTTISTNGSITMPSGSTFTKTGVTDGCGTWASGVLGSTGTACGGGGGSGTVSSGTTGQIPYYAGSGTTLTATSSLFLAASGNVGLGTTTPTSALFVVPAGAGVPGITVQGTTGQTADLLQVKTTAGAIGLSVDSSGTINALSQIQFNSPVYTQFQATQPGVNLEFKTVSGGGDIRFSPNAVTSAYFSTSGNVGIGSSTPWGQLSVNPSGLAGPAFVIGSSSATTFVVTNGGSIGIGTSTPYRPFSVAVNTVFSGIAQFTSTVILPALASITPSNEGEIGIDTTDNQFKFFSGGGLRVVSPTLYPAFTYATSTAWTGTTTIPLGPAYVGETWAGVKCFTDAGTLNVSFYDGTNRMNLFNASTTVGTIVLNTNNSFVPGEKRYIDVGTPASSPTKISCSVAKTIDPT